MLSLKVHAIITGALFATIIVMAIVGGVLHDQGILKDSSTTQIAARYVFFTLFLAFGFSAIPLMLKLFLVGQGKIGNGDLAIIRAMNDHQTGIVVGFWLFLLLGLSLAIPAAVRDGFFNSDPPPVAAPKP